jgi:hypothetical protein
MYLRGVRYDSSEEAQKFTGIQPALTALSAARQDVLASLLEYMSSTSERREFVRTCHIWGIEGLRQTVICVVLMRDKFQGQ